MEKLCQQCGLAYKARSQTQKFCSAACLGTSQRTAPKECQRCGEAFQPKKGSAIKFCSPKCVHESRMEPQYKTCAHCQKEYLTHSKPSKFCSVECRRANAKLNLVEGRRIQSLLVVPKTTLRTRPPARGMATRPCDACQALYEPSHTYQQFCSAGCKNTAHAARMKGKANSNYRHGADVDHYSLAFKKIINKQVRAQYGACFQCGATTSLHAHHLDENKTNNTETNLACLCASCHMRFHKSGNQELRESMTSLWRKTIASWPKDS